VSFGINTMHQHNQTIADLERESAPTFWEIIGGAFLFLAAVFAVALILAI
jgi:hypothetical protein